MLGVAFLMLIAIIALLKWAMAPVMREPRKNDATSPQEPTGVSSSPSAIQRSAWIPALSVLLLIGMGAERLTFQPPSDAAAFHARVRTAAERIPMRIGDWEGQDVSVPYDVLDRLRPNVLISRRYENPADGRPVTLLLVQCEDARLLAGHFPPTCYHNEGFAELSAEPRDWATKDLRITGMIYEFSRSATGPPSMTVANFVVMPDGRVLRDITAVDAAANDMHARYYGAAEVQIVLEPDTPHDQRDRIIGEFAEACAPVIQVVRSGTPAGAEPRRKRGFLPW